MLKFGLYFYEFRKCREEACADVQNDRGVCIEAVKYCWLYIFKKKLTLKFNLDLDLPAELNITKVLVLRNCGVLLNLVSLVNLCISSELAMKGGLNRRHHFEAWASGS